MVSVSVGAVDIFRLSSFIFFACGGHLLCLMVVVVRLGTRAARPRIIAYLCRLRQAALVVARVFVLFSTPAAGVT